MRKNKCIVRTDICIFTHLFCSVYIFLSIKGTYIQMYRSEFNRIHSNTLNGIVVIPVKGSFTVYEIYEVSRCDRRRCAQCNEFYEFNETSHQVILTAKSSRDVYEKFRLFDCRWKLRTRATRTHYCRDARRQLC